MHLWLVILMQPQHIHDSAVQFFNLTKVVHFTTTDIILLNHLFFLSKWVIWCDYQDTQWCVVQPSTASADVRQTSVYFAGTKKTLFSCIHSSIVLESKLTNFAVDTSLGWDTSYSKFELNPPSHHWDMHLQNSSYFSSYFSSSASFFFFLLHSV